MNFNLVEKKLNKQIIKEVIKAKEEAKLFKEVLTEDYIRLTEKTNILKRFLKFFKILHR